MTILDSQEIASFWYGAGGTPATAVVMVSIAKAESGGDPDIVSPTHDYGLWQINEIHSSDSYGDWSNILDPSVNAAFAYGISSGGSNVAAWATCYADLGASGWSTFMSTPEPGSAAASFMAQVAAELSAPSPVVPVPPTPAPVETPVPGSDAIGVQNGMNEWVNWVNNDMPVFVQAAQGVSQYIGGLHA